MKKSFVYILILVVIVVFGIIVGVNLKDDNNEVVPTTNQKTENKVENKVENNVQNAIQNKVENNEVENVVEEEIIENGIPDKAGEPKTDVERAIEIVKEKWGTDSSVKFEYEPDEKMKAGEFIISVRDINSTNALMWYKVDINNETCEEW